MKKSFDERFYPRVNITDGCWHWTGAKDHRGYGRYCDKHRAHVAAWMHFVGPVPAGMCVCHKCDVPDCANPDHLFLGTKGDNNRDRHAKGRTSNASRNVGQSHGRSVLTDDKVVMIRRLRRDGVPCPQIAEQFGISKALVSAAAIGKRWPHVSEPPCARAPVVVRRVAP